MRYRKWKERVVIKIIRYICPHGNLKAQGRVTNEKCNVLR